MLSQDRQLVILLGQAVHDPDVEFSMKYYLQVRHPVYEQYSQSGNIVEHRTQALEPSRVYPLTQA